MEIASRRLSTRAFGGGYKNDDRTKTGPDQSALNPYVYTSGRWLRLDDAHQKSRHVDFDFPALLQKAVDASPGATGVLDYEEKLEGGYDRAFVLRLDNGARVVARIPFRTLDHPLLRLTPRLRQLPIILAWSDDAMNVIGTEYIIMSHVTGDQLHTVWPKLDPRLHFSSVKALVDYMCQLSKLSFPAYGSIYFEDGPLSSSEMIVIGDGFCIGPSCHPEYWPGTPGEPRSYTRRSPNRGPWRDLESYVHGLIDNGYSLLPDSEPPILNKWQGSIEEHLYLLKEALARNIFISDTGIITGIIDWQFAAVEPTFAYADTNPDFLFPHENIEAIAAMELGPGADEFSVQQRSTKVKNRFDILQKLFSVGLQASMRDLHEARALDPMLLRPFKYCGTSWRDSAVALQEELGSVSREWTALGLVGSCPYQLTAKELEQHKDRFEDLEAAMELKMAVVQATGSDLDGWLSIERFDAAVQTCHELYVKRVEGENGNSRRLAESMWPFDVR
ncbi:Altered inheritance of mitochondria protein [Lachnellula suecica]|uniref:Altered inheritance of mitochondria protein 9, mitochondrial n=1 Tax=Lachnellula suecica TaxID=602035 RepID=A0A8T9C0V1_9HELO|nr:Altered inheritance of mitochondria protein [Lachnellula suecica]